MVHADRERLVAHLQIAVNAALELSGYPKNAWGSFTIRVQDGRAVLPLSLSAEITIK